MKRFMLVYCLLLVFNAVAQDTANYKNEYYEVVYSQIKKQPLKCSYKVMCNSNDSVYYSRAGVTFKYVKGITTSTNADYVDNDYDKGHLAPEEDFACNPTAMVKTFLYVNCALQHQALNRGAWKYLEQHERWLAKDTSNYVYVVVEVVFDKKPKKTKAGASIPKGFYKYIYINEKLVEKYYFDNVEPKYASYKLYLIK